VVTSKSPALLSPTTAVLLFPAAPTASTFTVMTPDAFAALKPVSASISAASSAALLNSSLPDVPTTQVYSLESTVIVSPSTPPVRVAPLMAIVPVLPPPSASVSALPAIPRAAAVMLTVVPSSDELIPVTASTNASKSAMRAPNSPFR
jgi:hypothetical protein